MKAITLCLLVAVSASCLLSTNVSVELVITNYWLGTGCLMGKKKTS